MVADGAAGAGGLAQATAQGLDFREWLQRKAREERNAGAGALGFREWLLERAGLPACPAGLTVMVPYI